MRRAQLHNICCDTTGSTGQPAMHAPHDTRTAAGHETRLALLLLLADAGQPVRTSEIAKQLGARTGDIRHHARKLADGGLIEISQAQIRGPGRPENQMTISQRGATIAAKLSGRTGDAATTNADEVGVAVVARITSDAVRAFESGDTSELVAELLGRIGTPRGRLHTVRISRVNP